MVRLATGEARCRKEDCGSNKAKRNVWYGCYERRLQYDMRRIAVQIKKINVR